MNQHESRLQAYRHDEGVHPEFRVIGVLFGETRIDDIVYPIYGDTRLGDVGGNDNFASSRWRRVKDTGLHLRRKSGVNRKDE